MKDLQKEFEMKFIKHKLFGHGVWGYEADEVWNWIHQNYISKEEILNLECLKEERHNKWQGCSKPEESCYVCDRNQLRKEIIDEINKL